MTDKSGPRRPAARHVSLRARLILLVVVSLVPLIAYTLGRRYFDYQDSVANSGQQTLALARRMSLAMEKELQRRIATLQVLALSQRLHNGDLAGFRTQAEAVVAEQFPGSNIILLKNDGQQLMNTLLAPGAPLPIRPNLEATRQVFATGQPAVSGVYQAAIGPRKVVAIDVPVRGADGSILYALSTNPRLDAFAEVIRDQQLPEGWVVSIFDGHGVNVARNLSPEKFVGQKAGEALLPRLLAEREGVLTGTSREGIELVTAFSHTAQYNWSVAVGLPLADLTRPAVWAAVRALVAGGVALVLGLALALYVSRQITGPMALLRRMADETEGESNIQLVETRLPEANEVAEALWLAQARWRESERKVREHARSLEQEVEERRRVSEILEALVQQSTLAIVALDAERRVILWNPAAEKMFGYSADEVRGQLYPLVPPELQQAHIEIFEGFAAGRRVQGGETMRRRKDGSEIPVTYSGAPLYDREQRFRGIVFMLEDATERQALEQQLRQSQKMEAVGQLTGGIAHDFNNILTIIIGNADFLMGSKDRDPEQTAMVEPILNSALRGAEMTRRLLAFARRQSLQPQTINLNERLVQMTALLSRLLGETIHLAEVFAEDLWPTDVDPTQVEDALVNLAINARDAMPGGGDITIETANTHLDEHYAALNAEVTPGDYVVLSVTDTGCGMPPEVIERAVEPFFTTKEQGKGTGLGLSMIYGFTKQSGGHLKIYSEVGHGTTVKLYLPRASADQPTAGIEAHGEKPMTRGHEAILLVEDDAGVRDLALRLLTELGYRVTTAEHGPAALEVIKSGATFDLLFTDAVMPEGMTGEDLATAARRLVPGLKVLFTTGYARVHSKNGNGRHQSGPLIRKPYRRKELAEKIREVLDSPS